MFQALLEEDKDNIEAFSHHSLHVTLTRQGPTSIFQGRGMWKKQQLFPHLSHRLCNLLSLNIKFVSVNGHVGASCSWDSCVAIKARAPQWPFSFLLSSKADPAADISDLERLFCKHGNTVESPTKDRHQ